MNVLRIVVLASGNGTNLQALIDAEKAGRLGPGHIVGVISDQRDAHALKRAASAGIPVVIEEVDAGLPVDTQLRELSDRLLRDLRDMNAELIILAGFLVVLEGEIVDAYAGRIINLHPSLLPKYGGAGMYGETVHLSVLAAGETESGCTVHIVDAGTDTGPILLQRKVPVLRSDTAETLAERIHGEEHIAIVEAAALMAEKLSVLH
ncbi:phosphoribosylglycinamide formyltransferase [Spirochaetia bacterium]|nr:phosphoribosylglycinamide formyltransferase [Spirochaetia bacterium]